MKKIRKEMLNSWIKTLLSKSEGNSLSSKDLKCLNKLNTKQLDSVLSLISASYCVGCLNTSKQYQKYLKNISK